MLTLAQIPEAAAASLVTWMVGFSAAVFFINQVLTFYKVHIKEQPSPANTYATKAEHAELSRKVGAFATKQEHDELRVRVDGMSTDIRESFERLDKKRSVSIAGLHTKVEQATAEIRREIKSDMGGVHDRLSTVLSAVSELKGTINR